MRNPSLELFGHKLASGFIIASFKRLIENDDTIMALNNKKYTTIGW